VRGALAAQVRRRSLVERTVGRDNDAVFARRSIAADKAQRHIAQHRLRIASEGVAITATTGRHEGYGCRLH